MAEQSFFSKFTSIYTDKSINGWVRGIAWIDTFENAPTDGNMERYQIMEQFISDFENNNLIIHGY